MYLTLQMLTANDDFTPVAGSLVSNVLAGETALVQIRVWESGKGPSYEIARALGGKFGKSNLMELPIPIVTGPPPPRLS